MASPGKVNIIFYNQLSLKSAVRNKLRQIHSVQNLEKHQALSPHNITNELQINWMLKDEAWPETPSDIWHTAQNTLSPCTLALSCGHLFRSSQLQKLNQLLLKISTSCVNVSWFLDQNQLTNISPGEFPSYECEYLNLNSAIQDFDFSQFACNPRQFNEVIFDSQFVTKICHLKQKGEAEIGFFDALPDKLKPYYPKLINSHIEDKFASYKMTNLRRFDLGRLILEDSFTDADWQAFYFELRKYFTKLPKLNITNQLLKKKLEHYFIEKLKYRLEEFRKLNDYESLLSDYNTHTGSHFESDVNALLIQLKALIDKSSQCQLYFSHGDLCFSNILYDIEDKELNFIDPRGIEAEGSSYRPIEYDLAKMSHSALGSYDAIARNSEYGKNALNLSEIYFKEFLKEFEIKLDDLRLYEASLFYSLLPLHLNHQNQLLKFMLAGQNALRSGS